MHRTRRCAGVAVTATIPGSAVDPVSVHPPTAHPAHHQPGQQIAAGPSVFGFSACAHSLDRCEGSVIDKWTVGQVLGDFPRFRRIGTHSTRAPTSDATTSAVAFGAVVVPHLSAGIPGVLDSVSRTSRDTVRRCSWAHRMCASSWVNVFAAWAGASPSRTTSRRSPQPRCHSSGRLIDQVGHVASSSDELASSSSRDRHRSWPRATRPPRIRAQSRRCTRRARACTTSA
jgi:hypothetical protein